eukprot:m.197156 g.197156  ORF g.197156 m.197156 type:complete len:1190 (+) comp17660_c1_seq4:253-3822(+)
MILPAIRLVQRLFYSHGLLCASNPFRIILIGIVSAILFSAPAIPGLIGRESSLPRTEIFRPNEGHVPAWFHGQEPDVRLLQVYVQPPQRSSVFSRTVLEHAGFTLPRKINEFSTEIDGKRVHLSDFCVLKQAGSVSSSSSSSKNKTECALVSVGLVWGGDINLLRVDSDPRVTLGKARNVPSTHRGSGIVAREALMTDAQCQRDFCASASSLVISIPLRPSNNTDFRRMETLFLDRLSENVFPASSSGSVEGGLTYISYDDSTFRVAEIVYLLLAYVLVFIYIHVSVSKFEMVKSKIGLGFTAVAIVFSSMMMSVGICTYFQLLTTVKAIEVVPFFVMAIGLDNMVIITTCTVNTSPDLPIRFRVAEGLARAGLKLTRSLLTMEALLVLGVYTHITALQEFCVIACIGILCDFYLQVVLYVAVLSLDIRRMELSDLACPSQPRSSLHRTASRVTPPATTEAERSLEQMFKESREGLLQTNVYCNNAFLAISLIAALIIGLLNGATYTRPLEAELIHSLLPTLTADWRGLLASLEGSSFLSSSSASAATAEALSQGTPLLAFLPVVLHQPTIAISDPPPSDDAEHMPTSFDLPDWVPEPFQSSPPLTAFVLLAVLLVGRHFLKRMRGLWLGFREGVDTVALFGLAYFDVQTLKGHVHDVECLATVDGSNRIVSASFGGQVRVWDPSAGVCLEVLSRHERDGASTSWAAPWSVAACGDLIAVGFGNGTKQVFDLTTNQSSILVYTDDMARAEDSEPHVQGGITNLMFWDNCLLSTSATGVLEQWRWQDQPPYIDDYPLNEMDLDSRHSRSPSNPPPMVPPPLSSGLHVSQSSTSLAGMMGQVDAAGQPVPHIPVPKTHRRTRSDGLSWQRRESGASTASASAAASAQPERLGGSQPTITVPERVSFGSSSIGGGGGGVGGGPPDSPDSPEPHFLVRSDSVASSIASSTMHSAASHADGAFRAMRKPPKLFSCFRSFACHRATITALKRVDDLVVTASADHTLRVFNKDLDCRFVLRGHEGSVNALDAYRDGHIASGSADKTVRVWHLRTEGCRHVLKGHTDAVLNVQMNHTYVVSSSEDDTARIWLVDSGRCLRVLTLSQAFVGMALHDTSILVTVTDGKVTCWDISGGGERLRTFPLSDDTVSPMVMMDASGSSNTHNVLLVGSRLICDYGRLIKSVALPFPQAGHEKTS